MDVRKRCKLYRSLRVTGLGRLASARVALSRNTASALLLKMGPRLLEGTQRAARLSQMSPFIMWGTLLGYRRDGGFIAHDTDIDFCIFSEELTQLRKFQRELDHLGLELKLFTTPFRFQVLLKGLPDLHADIWVLYPDGEHFVTSMPEYSRKGHFVYRLPAGGLRDFQDVELAGCIVRAPLYIDALLILAYADWREPDPGFRDEWMPCARLQDSPPEVDKWPPDSWTATPKRD